MQVTTEDLASELERAVARELPRPQAQAAWRTFLEAHATLVRRLETDLEAETGLNLTDFDVLAQLAFAGGSLRMTDLAERALLSRSGMTRRVARLVGDGLVSRCSAESDARGVVVSLTSAGEERLLSTAPVHARGINELFATHLDDEELTDLQATLAKLKVECSFG
jgi:DNA-binding MarR family transcriptional regulator